MRTLSKGGHTDLDATLALYATLEANAPAKIRADVLTFVALSRAISTAFAGLASDAPASEERAVFDSLSPEQQRFARDLADLSKGADARDGAAKTVLTFFATNCR